MTEIIFFYITAPNLEEANKISNHLISKKLAACCNIFPIKSVYFWQEKINNDNEYVIIAKTIKEFSNELISDVEKIHSFETPCIAQFIVNVNKAYYKWIESQLK